MARLKPQEDLALTHFFFHLPKTGGTSFKRVLEKWFATARDQDCTAQDLRRLAEERPSDYCLHGHFGGSLLSGSDSLLARYPWIAGNPSAQVFTFLRDPMEHAIAVYYHEVEHGRTEEDLLSFLSREHKFGFALALGIRSTADIDAALSSFAFVGITEALQTCADRMANLWDKPKIVVPRERVGARDGQLAGVTREHRRKIEAMYTLEYEAYERVRSALEGGGSVSWSSEAQFRYLTARRVPRARAALRAEPAAGAGAGRLTDVIVHGEDGEARGEFSVTEAIGVTLTFDILEEAAHVEPAIGVTRDGRKVFTAAFTPKNAHARPLRRASHVATAWIPAHLLNPGHYEIDASLATPHPVTRHAATATPILVEITEAAAGERSARGSWKGQFPGAVRPLLEWDIET